MCMNPACGRQLRLSYPNGPTATGTIDPMLRNPEWGWTTYRTQIYPKIGGTFTTRSPPHNYERIEANTIYYYTCQDPHYRNIHSWFEQLLLYPFRLIDVERIDLLGTEVWVIYGFNI